MKNKTITAYKGLNKDLTCRGHQYEIGQTYVHEGDVKACDSGFHACEYPLDVFSYYPPASSSFAVVEQSGTLIKGEDASDSKVASSSITLKASIDLPGIINAAIEYTQSRTKKPTKKASNSGYYGAASNSGSYGTASNSGNYGTASNSGVRGAASNSGDYGAASNSGDYGAASNSGNYGAASNSGDYGAASNSGVRGVAMACGRFGVVSGCIGSALFLVERDDNWKIIAAWAGIVGINGIEPDVFYMLKNGVPEKAK
jgi:hypothetical protein